MLKTFARIATSQPYIYELVQELFGKRAISRRIWPLIADSGGAWLDIGSSSGSFSPSQNARQPIYLDVDLRPLLLARRRRTNPHALAGDAVALPLQSRSVDLTTCLGVTHHLDEIVLGAMLKEIARVTFGRFILLDALRVESRLASRILWRYDRGAYPRTKDQLETAVSRHFIITAEFRFRLAHDYWLAVAQPLHSAPG